MKEDFSTYLDGSENFFEYGRGILQLRLDLTNLLLVAHVVAAQLLGIADDAFLLKIVATL